jgi:hypothetical protein
LESSSVLDLFEHASAIYQCPQIAILSKLPHRREMARGWRLRNSHI